MLLIILFSITCVSAADDNQTDVAALEEDTLLTEISHENDDVGNFSSLNDEIANCQGTTLELKKDYALDKKTDSGYEDGIVINKDNFVIDGKGHTLNANGNGRILNIISTNVTLKNITFINVVCDHEGAAYFENFGSVIDCRFTNNFANWGACGVHFEGNGMVANSNFTNNLYGSPISFYGNGTVINSNFMDNAEGAIYGYDLNVADSTFINNTAHAAIYSHGKINLVNSVFINNVANHGGAIYCDGNVNAVNVKFRNNKAQLGGAIYSIGDLYIEDVVFEDNVALGSTFNIYHENGNLTLKNVTPEIFSDYVCFKDLNDALSLCTGNLLVLSEDYTFDPYKDNDFKDGFIIDRDNFIIDGAGHTIDGLTIARIFYVTAKNVTIKNIKFAQAFADEGAAVYFNDTGFVFNSSFLNNNGDRGSAIFFNNGGTVGNSVFSHNSGEMAIYFQKDGTVQDSIFTNQIASCVQFYNTGRIINSTFTGNLVDNRLVHFEKEGEVINSTFSKNRALGLTLFLKYGKVINSTFSDNTIPEVYSGAGAVTFIDNGVVTNSKFINNTGYRGPAITLRWIGRYDTTRYITVDNSLFLNNKAKDVGGAIYFDNGGVLTIEDSIFEGNQAIDKSFNIYLDKRANIVLDNVTPASVIPSNFQTLSEDIKKSGDIFTLTKDYFYDPAVDGDYVNGVVVDKEGLIIDGAGHFIDGAGIARVFNITAGYAVIKNITIRNGNSTDGGAAYFIGSGTIQDSTFINNHATHYSGAVHFTDTSTVVNSIFIGNRADFNSGAIHFTADGTVMGSTFTDNEAPDGGAIYHFWASKPLVITNSNFTNNTAFDGEGGAIYSVCGNVIITGSNFIDNHAGNRGAALYLGLMSLPGSTKYYANITNCNFTGNHARDGGAIYSRADTDVTFSNFASNVADRWGGAIYFDKANNVFSKTRHGRVNNSNFVHNSAGVEGGAIYFYDYGTASESNFINNYAYSAGGAIYLNEGNVSKCYFEGNEVDYYNFAEGGAVYFKGSGNVSGSVFNNNSAADGGAIFFNSTGFVNLSTFTYNLANHYGGAIYFDDAGSIFDSSFSNNDAHNGGAVYFNTIGEIGNSNFTDNKATFDGGAVFINENGTVSGSIFIGNHAQYGGAVNIENEGKVVDSKFIDNGATSNGGAVYILGNGEIISCEFEENAAGMTGGAICANDATFEDSSFINNEAIYGGGLYAAKGTIKNTDFTYNKAESGGAIGVLNEMDVDNCTFEGNVAGDGIDNVLCEENASVTITNTSGDLGPSFAAYISANAGNITYGDTLFIRVNVTYGAGVPMKNGTVSVVIGGKLYSADVVNGSATIEVANPKGGAYNVNVTYVGDAKYNNPKAPVEFTVFPVNATISAKSASYIINYGGSYSVTVNGVAGERVSFTLNGKNIGSAVTNSKGVATIKLTAGILKSAKAGTKNLIIKLDSSSYSAAAKTVKVTIKKEKTKIAAKKKTFKRNAKTKKYSITLKNSKGKGVKKVQVVLKIKGKTFKAKTNSKGKATFKIKKFTKKGNHKAKITFKGNSNYLKASKKVNIKLK